MKEKLIIKNFGPIKSVELELGKFNVLIGDQGTGKSTVAKVLTAIQSTFFREIFDLENIQAINRETQLFFEYLKWFEIKNYFYDNTHIQYWSEIYYFELKNKIVELKKTRDISFEENLSYEVNYILAERLLAIILENSLYALIETKAYLPRLFLRFGNKFQKARIEKEFFDYTEIIGVKYSYKDNNSIITLPSGKQISINEASTGIQGTVSLLTVFDSIIGQGKNKNLDKFLNYLIIEEPELNCFPETQNKLLKYIVEKITVTDRLDNYFYKFRLLITTHSPYILTSLNNLMYAYKVGQSHNDEANNIIEKKYRINSDDVSVYLMLPNGECEDIFDREEGMIRAEKIDSVSTQLNTEFVLLQDIELAVGEDK